MGHTREGGGGGRGDGRRRRRVDAMQSNGVHGIKPPCSNNRESADTTQRTPHLHVVWVSRRHGGLAPGSASLRSCSAINARRDPPVNASPTRNLIRAGQRRLSRRRALLQQIEDVDGETLITINELQLRSLPLALRGLRLGIAFPLLHLWFFVSSGGRRLGVGGGGSGRCERRWRWASSGGWGWAL
jgi:hypothetical protein